MPHYTPEQIAHALELAHEEGVPHAARTLGYNPGTIRRWAKRTGTTLPVVDSTKAAAAKEATAAAAIVAESNRASTRAEATERLAHLVHLAGDIAHDGALVVADTLLELRTCQAEATTASANARESGTPEDWATADLGWKRVRTMSDLLRVQGLAYGLAVDKLAKLAGEDSPLPPAGDSGPTAAVNVAVLMSQDPEFRAIVVGGLADRVAARRAGSIEASASEP